MSEFEDSLGNLLSRTNSLPADKRLEFLQKSLLAIVPAEQQAKAEVLIFLLAQVPATATEKIVVLIHGIRTNAEWQDRAARVLAESAGFSVKPIKFGVLNLAKFWCPILTRVAPITNVLNEIRDIRAQFPTAEISVVAHSFGTYAIVKILQKTPDVQIHRLLLCGAIVEKRLQWQMMPRFPTGGVLNLCGTKDVMPILAKITTWGYGCTGRYGLGTNRVSDVFLDVTHSGFFADDCIKTYWVPFLLTGKVQNSGAGRSATPLWIMFLSALPLQWLIALAALWGACRLLYGFLG